MIVVIKFTAPSKDDVIRKINPISHNDCPLKKAWNPGPLSEMSESGVYEVQPPLAAPPGTKKLQSIMVPPTPNAQKLAAFTFGNVMSGAPICSGTTKFPKAANATGTTPRKIMIVPCIAPRELYPSGVITPLLKGLISPRSQNHGSKCPAAAWCASRKCWIERRIGPITGGILPG